MAVNEQVLADEDGDFSDWIEIHNLNGEPVDLHRWYLTDDPADLAKWQFPPLTLAAGDCLLVFASDKDRSQGELHTNFKLRGGGEYLALARDGVAAEFAYEPQYPPQVADVSFGLAPDGSAQGYFSQPTPGLANAAELIDNPTRFVVIDEIMYHPASENRLEEYIELLNFGAEAVDLAGWQFANGVEFTFPNVTIAPGEHLVVAADVSAFQGAYTDAADVNVIGGWTGRLSNRGETIELVDESGIRVDRVRYADEGDWAVRQAGPLDRNHYGWIWSSDHDGGGKSLELINPAMPNELGQNWAASLNDLGTPGVANSVADADVAPMVLEVTHQPAIPSPTDTVTVTARLIDESAAGLTATLYARPDAAVTYETYAMLDDGQSGDGRAGDGVYGAAIPPFADGTIVEFYVEAGDGTGQVRTWPAVVPAPAQPADAWQGEGHELPNLLYQVDDTFDGDADWVPGSQPIYYLILTEAERAELTDIGVGGAGGEQWSDAQMSGTFISVDGLGVTMRYNVGIRNRGNGSRGSRPNNYRVNFPHDRPWQDVTAINVNSRYAHYQLLGHALFRMAGLPAEEGRQVQVRVNGADLAETGGRMYGSYVHLQAYDSDYANWMFPGDGGGNLYNATTLTHAANLSYRGTEGQSYLSVGYAKNTNQSENDWSDLIHLTDVLNNAPEETYVEDVAEVIDVDQWLTWFAIQTLISNGETNLGNGVGDDYSMYRGVEDPRFVLLPHDLDTILGRGGTSDANASIYRATNLAAIRRFLTHPEFAPRYHAALMELIETVFSPQQFNPLADRMLGGHVAPRTIENIKQFVVDRNAAVLAQIPQQSSISSDLPQVDGYLHTTVGGVLLEGTADASETVSVLVDGRPVEYLPTEGRWFFSEAERSNVQTLVDVAAPWRYLDDGSDQQTAWREPGFDDSVWPVGQGVLAYETGTLPAEINTVLNRGIITHYFRGHFDFDGDPQDYTLELSALVDDGAVVYVNGVEVHRVRMAEGDTNWETLASNSIGNTVFSNPVVIPSDVLQRGDNVIAAEVHQHRVGSSDVVFGLNLDAVGPPDPAAAVPLSPGIHRVFVQTFDGPDGTGDELQREYVDVWYEAPDGETLVPSGPLVEDLVLAAGAYRISGEVVVPAGVSLRIEPGTTVMFDQGGQLTVYGRLLAEGSQHDRIRLTRPPGSAATWNGLVIQSDEDNRLTYVDMEYASAGSGSIALDDSRLLIDQCTWTGTDGQILGITDSSLIVRDSVFPDTVTQTVYGRRLLPSDPYLLFERNVFGVCSGNKQDVVDFTVSGSTPSPRFIDNVFLGGGDDGLDLDGTNAHIEGNVFLNFRKNFDPDNTGADGEAHAITTGDDGPYVSNHTIVRNVFIDCDHAVLVKDRSWVTFENNTLVGCDVGLNFHEPRRTSPVEPGVGAYLDGNILLDTPTLLTNVLVDDPVWGSTDVTVNRSIVPADAVGLGVGNLAADPLLADPAGGDFSLLPGSPTSGSGPNGLDMGAMVPGGVSISGAPPALTGRTDATLTLAGPGITHYRYRVNETLWSAETPVDTPVELAGLPDGQYTVFAVGKDSAGIWQDEADAAMSRTWTVDTSLPGVRINEVLAINAAAVEYQGSFPDLIELVNEGAQSVDLSGMSLSDDVALPAKFVFPADTVLAPGEFLVLYGDDEASAPGLHVGFALRGSGEGVFLFDAAASGGRLLDSAQFGLQIADLSIGRIGEDGRWGLTQPTFGSANVAQRTGDPASLRFSEWLTNGLVRFADDFLELYNPDPLPVPLGGVFLTDHFVGQPDKHEIAALSFIAGGGLATLVADGDTGAGADHVDFRLSADQAILGLFDAELRAIDKVIYLSQTADVSEGRDPDDKDSYGFARLPTPGLTNMVAAPASARVIAINDVWRYDESGGDLGTAWREPLFDDSSWSTGQSVLAWEDASLPAAINTDLVDGVVTYYFRKQFTVDAAPAHVTLRMSPLIDDGAVFYLNGVEVLRQGMPEGDVDYQTRTNRSVVNADFEGPFLLPTDALLRGENVLAVEVHQNDSGNPDIVLGLILDAIVETPVDRTIVAGMDLLDALRISELMYHPIDGGLEFVELINAADATLELGGVRFTEGIDFTFPEMLLLPGQTVVVVRDLEAFYSYYGPGVNVAGQYSGNLSDNGENLVLKLAAPLEAAVLRFEFDDSWYPPTDGGGWSLTVRNSAGKAAAWRDAEHWQVGSVADGSPGRADGEDLAAGVVINEVLSHTDAPLVDAIELLNTSDGPIDVGGWYLSDSAQRFTKFRIPDGTVLAAGAYVVFDESDFNPAPSQPGPNDFALDGAFGDDVWLVEADETGRVLRVVDYVLFAAAAQGESFGRWPSWSEDAQGIVGSLYPMVGPTLGDPNSGPRVGPLALSEVHYNPGEAADVEDLEFVEIYNPTDAAVALDGWRLRKGIDFDFPAGTTIAPRSTLLVLPFDPQDPAEADSLSALLTHYGIDAAVAMVGGYAGRLSNGGETVQLQRPDEPPLGEEDFTPHLLEDEVRYDDVAPWPAEADAGGHSLHRRGIDSWGNDPASWVSAAPTPGTVDLVPLPAVVGRHIFYNNSAFDRTSDDAAITPDKEALLPGQRATLANYTSYVRGINGIMIDLVGLAGTPTAADFQFRVGNNGDTDGWTTAPPPQSITVRSGAGTGGADRVTVVWADNTIVGQWLQVTVRATAVTGLAEPDVFYLGNTVGEAGNSALNAIVNTTDEIAARNFQHGPTNLAAIDDPYDYNRDRLVNTTDRTIARTFQTGPITALQLISVPARDAAFAQGVELAAERSEAPGP